MASTGLSMTNEDGGKSSPEINIIISELNYYVERVDQKIIDLVHKNGNTTDDETNKAFKANIEALKKDEESVNKRLNEFMPSKQCELDGCNCLDSLTSLYEEYKASKLEEDGINKRSIQLCSRIEDKVNDSKPVVKNGYGNRGDELKVKEATRLKKDNQDYMKNWLNQLNDIHFNFGFIKGEENLITLISESEDSEEEEEMAEFKQKGDINARFLAMLTEFDSFDGLEDDEDSDCDGEEGSEDDGERGTTMDELKYLQLDDFDDEIHTNIEGLKEDMCAVMFQDHENYKKS